MAATVHPFNRLLSPGGSSGGEGALIASRGGPMGIGMDIGGSIVSAKMCDGVLMFSLMPEIGQRVLGCTLRSLQNESISGQNAAHWPVRLS
jgi:hypothetical protein